MFAIYKRELKSYFTTPLGYIFMALFLCANGLMFSYATLKQGVNSNVFSYFRYLLMAFILVIPILTMKLFSEEKKLKTEQLLLTSPVNLWQVVIGKFLAAYSLFAITFAVGSFCFLVLYQYGTPNVAVVLGSILGILLVGAACISVGVFISSLTENQLISAIGTMAILLAFIFASYFNSFIASRVVRSVLSWISILSRFGNYMYGVFDIGALLYYLSITFVFLFLTVRVFEKRRWE